MACVLWTFVHTVLVSMLINPLCTRGVPPCTHMAIELPWFFANYLLADSLTIISILQLHKYSYNTARMSHDYDLSHVKSIASSQVPLSL